MEISKLGVIANIIAVGAAVISGYLWMESQFQYTLDKRIAPYELLLQGLSLSQYGNSEKAIESLSKSFRELSKEEVSEATLTAVIDPYLSAIADADNPSEHWPDFKAILPYIENKIPLNGERKMHVGWIYLYTGHLKEAVDSFKHSIRLYGSDQDLTPSAESHWGLSLAYVAEGKPEVAFSEFLLAEKRDPFDYDVDGSLKAKEWLSNEWWVVQLRDTYTPNFEHSLNKFYSLMKNEQKKRASDQ